MKVVQSAELKAPLFVADAVGKLNVCVFTAEAILKSVPPAPVAKYCTCSVNPFKAVNPVENVVITSLKWPFWVCIVIVLPECVTYILTANLSVASNVVVGTANGVK